MCSIRTEAVTLRQAALIVGFAYLLNPVSYADFTIYPKLVIPGHIEQTIANIGAHHGAGRFRSPCRQAKRPRDSRSRVRGGGNLNYCC